MSGGEGHVWLSDGGSFPAWIRAAGLPVLREGLQPEESDYVLHLDRGERNRSSALSDWKHRLEREGLLVGRTVDEPGKKGQATRRFTVTVFDLEATDMRRVRLGPEGSRRFVERAEPDDRLRRIVGKAAVRAVYSLGMDFGQVEVETDSGGKPSIIGLSAKMRPSFADGQLRTVQAIRAFAERWAAETANRPAVKLGADPEFVLMSPEGKVVPASRFLTPDGAAGCDSLVIRGVKVWPLAELRPEPAEEPRAVAADLRRLLGAAARRFRGAPPLAWRAGAWPVRGLPLGGHVHVSGAALTGERLRALDNAVALPLRLLEPPGAAARRPRYGALGDFRRQPHGGFEYRTPPSWLVSPRLTVGVLALAKIAVEHARELAGSRPLDDDSMRDAFYGDGNENDDRLRERALTYLESLSYTDGYRKYAADIEPIVRSIRDRRHWDETADIRLKWGIPVS
ncbi:hypothetical protein E5161_02335 [Cohnella pontilimi]|uniref:PhiEco32-like amidoligase-type 2 protein n=1 Tax=Cohnella pontilimi TaxID=2564100 RepID=A0A4U0FH21_9BACL|nr:hypothetical protein [Cohnella pontilimi]TJY44247.1 hypothetical protein E5161_02335 [Cohnella pontilimi]